MTTLLSEFAPLKNSTPRLAQNPPSRPARWIDFADRKSWGDFWRIDFKELAEPWSLPGHNWIRPHLGNLFAPAAQRKIGELALAMGTYRTRKDEELMIRVLLAPFAVIKGRWKKEKCPKVGVLAGCGHKIGALSRTKRTLEYLHGPLALEGCRIWGTSNG